MNWICEDAKERTGPTADMNKADDCGTEQIRLADDHSGRARRGQGFSLRVCICAAVVYQPIA